MAKSQKTPNTNNEPAGKIFDALASVNYTDGKGEEGAQVDQRLPRVLHPPREHDMTDTSYFGASDADAAFFINAMIARFRRIIGTSGNPVTVTAATSNYVVSGADIVVSDGGTSVPVWIGVNCGRIIFVVRLSEKPPRCRDVFEFAFGGATKVGWSFHYQPTQSGEETSVWGTVETNALFVEGRHDTIPGPALTRDGAFWANDTALMMQSSIRTIQRENVTISTIMPEPL